MKAMILAAGRGARMNALTEHTPKPLLAAAGKPLIVYLILDLAKAGIQDIIINTSYLADQIKNTLGDGEQFGVRIQYSHEPTALETGGGIVQALPLLGNDPFLVVSSDIWTDYPWKKLFTALGRNLAHLVLVNNPTYHPNGDYGLIDGKINLTAEEKLTFASFGIYHPDLFKNCAAECFRLPQLFPAAISSNKLSGEHYQGEWLNVGTQEELANLEKRLSSLGMS